MSHGKQRYLFEQALREHGYNGSLDPLGVQLVVPEHDSSGYDTRQFAYPFEIARCPVTMETVRKVSRAIVADYPFYWGLEGTPVQASNKLATPWKI